MERNGERRSDMILGFGAIHTPGWQDTMLPWGSRANPDADCLLSLSLSTECIL